MYGIIYLGVNAKKQGGEIMLEVALKLLEEITSRGFKAYIVGGFVRDYILGINSNDIDITTSATPKDIKEIFDDSCLPSEDYGSVTVIMKGIRFEITTFRKEIGYIDNRRPAEIKYIDDLLNNEYLTDYVKYMIERYYFSNKDAKKAEKNCVERLFKVVLRYDNK